VTDTTDKQTNERTDGRTDGRRDAPRLFVRPSLRWSLTLTAVLPLSPLPCHPIQDTGVLSTSRRCRSVECRWLGLPNMVKCRKLPAGSEKRHITCLPC